MQAATQAQQVTQVLEPFPTEVQAATVQRVTEAMVAQAVTQALAETVETASPCTASTEIPTTWTGPTGSTVETADAAATAERSASAAREALVD
ncbi:hypothetical protein [Mycolicibacter icosiumassiliensis]|uniref:hypothetical protein n=1 Tax=Mycolicibacter icosiumassiliensis TaxID=1792835 RepID=UPI0008298C01|nr:hypothetical protein [Mycolicibacter icosiumassiliensis]